MWWQERREQLQQQVEHLQQQLKQLQQDEERVQQQLARLREQIDRVTGRERRRELRRYVTQTQQSIEILQQGAKQLEQSLPLLSDRVRSAWRKRAQQELKQHISVEQQAVKDMQNAMAEAQHQVAMRSGEVRELISSGTVAPKVVSSGAKANTGGRGREWWKRARDALNMAAAAATIAGTIVTPVIPPSEARAEPPRTEVVVVTPVESRDPMRQEDPTSGDPLAQWYTRVRELADRRAAGIITQEEYEKEMSMLGPPPGL